MGGKLCWQRTSGDGGCRPEKRSPSAPLAAYPTECATLSTWPIPEAPLKRGREGRPQLDPILSTPRTKPQYWDSLCMRQALDEVQNASLPFAPSPVESNSRRPFSRAPTHEVVDRLGEFPAPEEIIFLPRDRRIWTPLLGWCIRLSAVRHPGRL